MVRRLRGWCGRRFYISESGRFRLIADIQSWRTDKRFRHYLTLGFRWL